MNELLPSTRLQHAAGETIAGAGRAVTLRIGEKAVNLSNLDKIFWPKSGLTKGDLLAYYASVARELLPHLADRAMVMKRYPNGIAGKFFFMKRTPDPRPDWLRTCSIEHGSGNVIAFPVIDDLASLLWVVNLGCIDLNPWYARCDDVNRPDYLHFDLDPVPPAAFAEVREAALYVAGILESLEMKVLAKTSGSRGVHLYVPIERGPTQKQVWRVAKRLAFEMAAARPDLLTAEYRIAARPPGRVLVDYNQIAWGRTLASVYSVRPREEAAVSAPITLAELKKGAAIEDFTIHNMSARVRERGDLWRPLLQKRGRFSLEVLL